MLEAIMKRANGVDRNLIKLTKDSLVRTASELHQIAGKDEIAVGGESEDAFEALHRAIVAEVSHQSTHIGIYDGRPGFEVPVRLASLFGLLQTAEGQICSLALLRWAHAGFPSIAMGHKFAAALLVTSATKEAVDAVRMPFPAMIIEMPDGLLSIDDPNTGQPAGLRRILVTNTGHSKVPGGVAWAYTAYTDSGLSVYRFGVSAAELLPPTLDEEEMPDSHGRERVYDPFDFKTTEADERVMGLVGKLIVNTCLAMSDPTKVREVGRSHELWRKRQVSAKSRTHEQPVVRVFQVGSPVKHDFRDAVKEYVTGSRKKITVQVLVSGHYKMQPHGPKSSLRKLIWREPFWRGPDDAPIPIRSHVLGKESE